MKKLIYSLFLLFISISNDVAASGIDTDKSVGLCMAYLTLTENPNARKAAIKVADKQDRAIQYAKIELDKVIRWNNEGKWNSAVQQGYAMKASGACREIGIRPADYK